MSDRVANRPSDLVAALLVRRLGAARAATLMQFLRFGVVGTVGFVVDTAVLYAGLAVGLGIPLAGIPTTTVLRAQATAADRLAVAAVDTRLGDWFCAIGDDPVPFAATAGDLAARLAGHKCLIVGKDVAPLAASLEAAGIEATVQEGPPDPVVLGRRALMEGVEAWRARNRAEGLPRPLYLRGVNITLPDGARRTVE